jgi:hypothetical protein
VAMVLPLCFSQLLKSEGGQKYLGQVQSKPYDMERYWSKTNLEIVEKPVPYVDQNHRAATRHKNCANAGKLQYTYQANCEWKVDQ